MHVGFYWYRMGGRRVMRSVYDHLSGTGPGEMGEGGLTEVAPIDKAGIHSGD